MFVGLRTVIYPVSDIERAKAWYSALLGQEPYFDQPFYVGYTVGGFELGLDPNGALAAAVEGGPVAYWGVDDIEAAVARLRELGAAERSAIQDVGEGILVARVSDPFGNQIGIIRNPHFSLTDVR